VRLARTFDAELDICAVLPVPIVTCAVGTRPGGEHLLDVAVRVNAAAGTAPRLVSRVPIAQ
jgi:hypothetical protein